MWRVSYASSPPRCAARPPAHTPHIPGLQAFLAVLTPCPLQERQSIIRFWLQNLRAKQGEALHNVRFLEDQPISE